MHPNYKKIRRKTILIGSTSLCIGLLGGLIPILPGTAFVLFGLSLLALHSRHAFTILAMIRARYPNLTNSIKKTETTLIDFFNLTTHRREYVSITKKSDGILSALLEKSEIGTGVAVLLHSASGVSESNIMESVAENFKKRGLTVLRFNAYHGLGDSSGDFSKFSTTNYREDLETILAWARTQEWWQKPLVLFGHSLGALVTGLYAQEHPEEVAELIFLAPTISGNSYLKTLKKNDPVTLEEWKEHSNRSVEHPLTKESRTLPYSFVEDILHYDLFPKASLLSMPTTILSSTNDKIADHRDSEELCKRIGKHATLITLHTIPHTPNTFEELQELQKGLALIKPHRSSTA